jgi:PPM family protein phosphatase
MRLKSTSEANMLFITRFIQTFSMQVRMFFGPLSSIYMRAKIYMRPGQAIKNQFSGVSARLDGARARIRSFGNSIIPESWRKRLGIGAPKKRKDKDGNLVDDEFGELDSKKSRRLGGGRKLNPLQKRTQFSQIHLIDEQSGQRQIAHIGQKIDRSWTEMIITVNEDETVRLSYTIVDKSVYGSNVIITYERGNIDIFIDDEQLTQKINLPVKDGSVITIGDIRYTLDMFAYELLPVQTRVDSAWVTNVGPVRDDNQDAIGLYQHKDAYMFTIADGVGGGYAGDIVSEYAVKYLLKTFQKNIDYQLSWIDILIKAFRHTNAEVRKFVERSPYPAGTTLTAVVIREWTAYIAHVGDSRVYHLRNTSFKQLTEDHREQHPVERTTKYEHIPDEFLPIRDVLVKAIGKRDDIEPQIITVAVQPGDKLLMITDGITHQVSNDELYNILISETIDDAPDKMVGLANDRENTDNASVILINVMEQAYERDIWDAVSSDRVFIGGKNWQLDLSRPHEMTTDYEVPKQVGCMWFIILLLIGGVFWWVPQQINTGTLPPTEAVVGSVLTDTETQIPSTSEPTTVEISQPLATVVTEVTATPVINETPIENTNVPTQASASHTPTPIPSPTFTPSPSSTPFLTYTPFPTLRPTQTTGTRMPPTSTLRA